jgi:hypothetical protein
MCGQKVEKITKSPPYRDLLLQNMAVMRGHTVQELRQQARGGDA